MLVLNRKLGEVIRVESTDGPVEIVILEVFYGGRARLGITAPSSVKINWDGKETKERGRRAVVDVRQEVSEPHPETEGATRTG